MGPEGHLKILRQWNVRKLLFVFGPGLVPVRCDASAEGGPPKKLRRDNFKSALLQPVLSSKKKAWAIVGQRQKNNWLQPVLSSKKKAGPEDFPIAKNGSRRGSS